MLKYLKMTNVGPAPQMEMEFGKRLNLITGDNGLGKSFLLDVAWWSLTRRWPHDLNPNLTSGYSARPTDVKKQATIGFRLDSKTTNISYESTYSVRDEAWLGKSGRPWNPGLVIYAHADGGFSVWDPARNYWKKSGNIDVQERLPGFVFSPQDAWNGLVVDVAGKATRVCKGLLDDWSVWIRENGTLARNMELIVEHLAPIGDSIKIGKLERLSINDPRDIPTISTPYAGEVPIVHASAGIRRILGLAYMLHWSWLEHRIAAESLGDQPTKQVVMLFDEIESHLHPRWQRTILGSLLKLVELLHEEATVQLIAATHSPMILASAEPLFDDATDAWFDLDLDATTRTVVLRRRPFVSHGDISNWLTSEAFDLKSARSIEAEVAIEKARELLRSSSPSAGEAKKIDEELRSAGLPDIDPFWVRWGQFLEKLGVGT